MEDDQKRSRAVSLLLIGVAAPLFLLRSHQDCYPDKTICQKDWGEDCEVSDQNTQTCRYLGRSYYGYGRSYADSGMHASGSITRGGFGSIGHAMSGGG